MTDDRTGQQFDRILADQHTHNTGQRLGEWIVYVAVGSAILLPVLAGVAGLSWRLFRWASGI